MSRVSNLLIEKSEKLFVILFRVHTSRAGRYTVIHRYFFKIAVTILRFQFFRYIVSNDISYCFQNFKIVEFRIYWISVRKLVTFANIAPISTLAWYLRFCAGVVHITQYGRTVCYSDVPLCSSEFIEIRNWKTRSRKQYYMFYEILKKAMTFITS